MPDDRETPADRLDLLLRSFPGGARALAAKIGVNETQVSRWRRGRTAIDWARAEQIAPVLGVSPGTLYAGKPGWKPPHLGATGDEPSKLELERESTSMTVAELLLRAERVDEIISRLERLERAIEEVAGISLDTFVEGDIDYEDAHGPWAPPGSTSSRALERELEGEAQRAEEHDDVDAEASRGRHRRAQGS
ncbi:helix-turn-helix transcriptional regulator [Patulibacter sp. SYSU D01012]|uniref:helix-turn-helix domain-containing protein n=1 Tax=Patulibacter sp. SYSU D01012 TaxID=2817381 RepID=UPI001B301C73|nr:helix-turn-helix transcriptional regulator [Patulibacter sp. SYSU D01012]